MLLILLSQIPKTSTHGRRHGQCHYYIPDVLRGFCLHIDTKKEYQTYRDDIGNKKDCDDAFEIELEKSSMLLILDLPVPEIVYLCSCDENGNCQDSKQVITRKELRGMDECSLVHKGQSQDDRTEECTNRVLGRIVTRTPIDQLGPYHLDIPIDMVQIL